MELLDCALLGVCSVIRSNTVSPDETDRCIAPDKELFTKKELIIFLFLYLFVYFMLINPCHAE